MAGTANDPRGGKTDGKRGHVTGVDAFAEILRTSPSQPLAEPLLSPHDLKRTPVKDLLVLRDLVIAAFPTNEAGYASLPENTVTCIVNLVGALINRDCQTASLETLKLLDIIDKYSKPDRDALYRLYSTLWRAHVAEIITLQTSPTNPNFEGVRNLYEKALGMADSLVITGEFDKLGIMLLAPLVNLARIYRKQGRYDDQDKTCKRIEQIVEAHQTECTANLCSARYELAKHAHRLFNIEGAIQLYESAVEMAKKLEAHRLQAYCEVGLAKVMDGMRQFSSASTLCHSALTYFAYCDVGEPCRLENTQFVWNQSIGAMLAQIKASEALVQKVRLES